MNAPLIMTGATGICAAAGGATAVGATAVATIIGDRDLTTKELSVAATDSSPARGKPESAGSAQTPNQAVGALNGVAYQELLNAGLRWLDQHHEIVNALNVFPVPDGDTGTNMLLTMRSACQEISSESAPDVGSVAKAAAHGALMGARGNSGVILSQILRGIARRLETETLLTGPRFAAALTEGSRIAYKGVNKPVEGTILTVAREAAEAAEQAARLNPDLRFVMERTLQAADQSVANTPHLLPILAQTGKVDSGGKGLYFILEGMYQGLTGETMAEAAGATAVAVAAPRPSKGRRDLPDKVYGFDVQLLIEARHLDVDTIRERITAMGEYPLVEGDERLIKIHVHVPDPGAVLSYAVGLGFVTDVVVENMDDMAIPEMPAGYDPVPPRFQSEELPATPPAAAQGPAEAAPTMTAAEVEGAGVVVVAPGPGLVQVFKSLGAAAVVAGGQTMNPSTQELLQAIRSVPHREVIILPNNSNIIMTAQQAQLLVDDGSGKQVAVVPTKTVPQGISALLALNPNADLAHNVQTMSAALNHVQTGEVTNAVHDAHFDGIQVHMGDTIGLLNDQLTARGDDDAAVVKDLLGQMQAADMEIITLYYGQQVTADAAEEMRNELRELYPDQEIEVVDGGQPFYHYIISAE
jgi:DAK2 domain fusion protein YloV